MISFDVNNTDRLLPLCITCENKRVVIVAIPDFDMISVLCIKRSKQSHVVGILAN